MAAGNIAMLFAMSKQPEKTQQLADHVTDWEMVLWIFVATVVFGCAIAFINREK